MIRCSILSLVAVLACSQLCRAQVQTTEVKYSAGPGERNVVQSDGVTAVPDGNFVEVGYFDSSGGFDPLAPGNGSDLSLLGSHWHLYGSAQIETFAPVGPPVPGRFRGDSLLNDPSFDSKKIYLWIFETTGNDAPAPDFSNVTQYGIFSSPLSAWTFPVDGTASPGNVTQISSSDVSTFVFGTATGSGPGSLELGTAAAVPEPGVISLLGLGLVLGRFCLRRRP